MENFLIFVHMKKLLIVALIGVTSMVSIQSCKKDEGASSAELIVGSWVQVNATDDGDTTWNDPDEWAPCEKDDITIFKADGTFTIDEGATKCDPDDPQINDSGNYLVSGNILTLYGFAFKIESISSTELKLSFDALGTTGTSTYKKL